MGIIREFCRVYIPFFSTKRQQVLGSSALSSLTRECLPCPAATPTQQVENLALNPKPILHIKP